MQNKFVTVYITAPTKKEAKKLGTILVAEKLAGCVSIVPNVDSIYLWNGRIQAHKESIIIAKTKRSLSRKIIQCMKKHHSYSTPCINFLPIENGNPDYLYWLNKETSRKGNK